MEEEVYDIISGYNIEDLTVKTMQDILKEIGGYHSLKNKAEYVSRLKEYKKVLEFPWREEQRQVIDTFLEYNHKMYIVHAVFGAGKSTLLMGMLIHGILKRIISPGEVMFLSFNISIKNEIKRKLKDYGLASKVVVRTFDSLTYELAKIGEYPYIDLPNFEGKRKFVYELIFNKNFTHKPEFQPKLIVIDEIQDLEKPVLDILKYFYPESKFVFAGDIFQSIQKDPKESILWHYMLLPDDPDVYKIYMSDTPRVPQNNLNTLKSALSTHYPEFRDKIMNWTSSNTVSESDIEWKRFNSYSHIQEELISFLGDHEPDEVMVLTFSSAITVSGAMGDIARLRRFLCEAGFIVNMNHKKQEPGSIFLSTANSSKGLERDYVIVFLTFPLERAFVNLSDDVVVNLLTVALTRAKKKVIMYVPGYTDKYTRALNLFERCPVPTKDRIREGKVMKEYKFQDYIDIEHSPTEIIRASVIKYDTRIKLREYTKTFNFSKIFDADINYKVIPIITEEERSFVGVLIENLITSTWISHWPVPPHHELKNHPFYCHIIKKITNAEKRYLQYTQSNLFDDRNQFDGILLYSQLHIAISNKIFMKLSDGLVSNLKIYWSKLKPKAILMKPNAESGKLKIQPNLRMPWIAGIADAMTEDSDGKTTSMYEIKASQDRNWTDNALIQVIMYALMLGKTWYRLHLLNPFQNQKLSYYFDTKHILSLRKELLKDVLIYNTNCFMAKTYPESRSLSKLDVKNTMFLNILRDDKGSVLQASVLNMVSPIKCEFIYDKYVTSGSKKSKDMSKQDRFACESELSQEDVIKELDTILNSEINKSKTVWSFDGKCDFRETKSIKREYYVESFEEVVEILEYKKNEDLIYSADLKDSLIQNLFCISFMFKKNYFV